MNFYRKTGKLKSPKCYLPKAYKFYNLNDTYFTPVIFTILLFLGFVGSFVPVSFEKSQLLTFSAYIAAGSIISKLALSVYLAGNIKQLKGEEFTLRSSLAVVMKNTVRILIASLLYAVLTSLIFAGVLFSGFFLLVIPGLVLYLMFMFNTCYIIDKGYGLIRSFGASKGITYRYMWKMFVIIMAFSFILFLAAMFIIGFFIPSNNTLVISFVLYFLMTLFNLMNEKLTALLYYDLEYGEYINSTSDSEVM